MATATGSVYSVGVGKPNLQVSRETDDSARKEKRLDTCFETNFTTTNNWLSPASKLARSSEDGNLYLNQLKSLCATDLNGNTSSLIDGVIQLLSELIENIGNESGHTVHFSNELAFAFRSMMARDESASENAGCGTGCNTCSQSTCASNGKSVAVGQVGDIEDLIGGVAIE